MSAATEKAIVDAAVAWEMAGRDFDAAVARDDSEAQWWLMVSGKRSTAMRALVAALDAHIAATAADDDAGLDGTG